MTNRQTLIRARPQLPRPAATQAATNVQIISSFADELSAESSTWRQYPSEHTITGLAGPWAALRKISHACAQMMVGAEAYAADGTTVLNPQPIVLEDPCAGYDSFDYWREMFTHGLARGNWIGVRYDFDPAGYPRQVMPVPMDSVAARWESGYPVYSIGGIDFDRSEIVHVRFGYTIPGEILAIGVVEAHRRGLQAHLDQQRMAGSVWSEGGVPSGIVQLDTDQVTTTTATTIKSNWISAHGGRRTVGVIGKKMTYVPIPWSAQDAQFLESRQFSIAEAALMFGLRPEDLGATFAGAAGAQTYGNRTDDALQRIVDSYTPLMLPVEQAWSRLISGRNFIKGDAEALLRSTPKDRMELHKLAQEVGVETVDESRALEGKGPAPKPAPITNPNPDPTGVPAP